MRLTDDTGRIGVVTSTRDDDRPGLFARPAELPYRVQGRHPGVGSCSCITATWWSEQPDGSYVGAWADDRLHTTRRATLTP